MMEHTEHVLVRHDQDLFALHDSGADRVLPKRDHPVNGHLEALARRQDRTWQHFVLLIETWVHLVIPIHRWWLQVVTASPLKNLSVTELLGRLLLVQALQLTIVPLI